MRRSSAACPHGPDHEGQQPHAEAERRHERRVAAAGLLERRPGHYALRLTVVALMLLGGWTAFALIGASWWQLAVAAWMAVTFAQVALVAHDLAHRQVLRTRPPSERVAMLVANLGIGMSYGW